MSKLFAAAMVRLDGVMQAPGGPDEDAKRCAGHTLPA